METTKHRNRVLTTDSALVLGTLLMLVSAALFAHQFGVVNFATRKIDIARATGYGKQAIALHLTDQPDNRLESDLGLLVIENGRRLKPTLEQPYLQKSNGVYFTSGQTLLVSSFSTNKDTALQPGNFSVSQPIPIPLWMISIAGIAGLVIFGSTSLIVLRVRACEYLSSRSAQQDPRSRRYAVLLNPLPTAVNFAICLCVFVTAWAVTGNWIRYADNQLDRSELAAKLDDVAQQDEFPSCVFLGSSRTHYHTNPIVFESEMAARGASTTAYNLGFAGCRAIEIPYVLDQIFQADSQRKLKFVFVQLEDFNREFTDANALSKQAIRIHDLSSIVLFAKHYFRQDDIPTPKKFQLLARRIKMFWHRQNNFGFGGQALDRWVNNTTLKTKLQNNFAKKNNGFVALERKNMPNHPEVRQIENRLANANEPPILPAGKRHKFEDSAASRKLIQAICEQIKDHGAIPVFVETPPIRNESVIAAYRAGEIPHLIELNDFEKQPEFFHLEHYFDFAHLNRQGSEMFSKRLAEEFVSISRSQAASVAQRSRSSEVLR